MAGVQPEKTVPGDETRSERFPDITKAGDGQAGRSDHTSAAEDLAAQTTACASSC